MISSIRILVEHVISGVKRCRIVHDVFRNTKAQFDDLVMEIVVAYIISGQDCDTIR
jgi:glycerol-3-phosphate cytidylyltransferase-like family protein